ncbi:hypothetical protein [Bradyrhizobium sp. AZCC 2289]|uniref:hypothetical protein n=1 Tax=Bradyrhizobium sp. AZCC 2289 TaxID=3117026 RepID=UPI002FEFA981
MCASLRSVLTALSFACLSGAFTTGGALAQAKQEAPPQVGQPLQIKQIALTEKQIQGVLAAQKDIDAINSKQPDSVQPDPKVIAQLDAVVKKNGLASYDEYNDVIYNISLVLGGFDPATKKYVGSKAVVKQQIAQVEADKKMSANDKKQALDGLSMALKSPEPPIENKGNVDLVAKYYDRLAELLGDDRD